jgi:hypothetical protein
MRFLVPVNDAADGESQTIHIIETQSSCARTNKRYLKEYLTKMGVREPEHKRVLKELGFWNNCGDER